MDVAALDRAVFGMQEAEGQRYAAFFGTLEQAAPQRVARASALAFFNKSSLSESEVESLYASIKSVGVVSDPSVMNETEFVMGMHLIVCLTKRGLASVPTPFPTYLFPSLPLPTPSGSSQRHADLISGMPSPEKPGVGRSSFSGVAASTAGSVPTSIPTEIAKLEGSTSLVELVQKEMKNNQLMTTHLSRIGQSETQTLQHLQLTLAALAAAVVQLGFPVPEASHASIGAVDDLGNLLRANVQSIKQEIQSLEISARMRSVADEATSRTGSRDIAAASPPASSEASAAIAEVAKLSTQLAALQHEAAQLQAKKDALARELLDKTTAAAKASVATATPAKTLSGPSPTTFAPPPPLSPASSSSSMGLAPPSSGWGDFSASPAAVAPFAPPQEAVRSTESTAPPPSQNDAFAFDAFEAPASSAPTAQPQDADFGWGAFQ